MTTKEIVSKSNTEMELFNAEFYSDVVGGGFEGVSVDDVAIPYLRVLQALSGEVKDKAKKVPGAEAGDIYLSAIGRLYKGEEGVRVVPCAFQKRYIERLFGVTGGSGFIASHSDRAVLTGTTRSADGRFDMLPNGNHIVETAYHYVIINDGGDYIRAVISFSSTQRKKSRAWLAMMGSIKWEIKAGLKTTPPSFSHQYLLTSGEESKGDNDWWGWVIGKPERVTERQLATDAKQLYLDVVGGKVMAGVETEELNVDKPKAEELPF